MTKLIYPLFILCIVSFLQVKAQDINSIRKQYYDIKETISMQANDINTKNSGELTISHNVPGSGPQTFKCTFYFTPCEYDENGYIKPHKLKFVQNKFNIAARNYYEEYLYDDNNNLIFIYGKGPSFENENMYTEIRLYFDNNILIKKISNDKGNNEPDFYQQEVTNRANSFLKILSEMNDFTGITNY